MKINLIGGPMDGQTIEWDGEKLYPSMKFMVMHHLYPYLIGDPDVPLTAAFEILTYEIQEVTVGWAFAKYR